MSGIAFWVVVALLLLFLAYLAIVRGRAADRFFADYAAARGMNLIDSDRARLPAKTPLLRKGDERYAERLLEGPLGGGFEGLLANYTYEENSGSGDDGLTQARHFTIAYLEVVESVPLVPELFMQPRTGPRAFDDLRDAFRGPSQRVELESEALARSHEIFVSEMQDLNRVRQLFSPSFIVWLEDEAPPGFAIELTGGKLCCYVGGHEQSAERLDRLASATTAVAGRLRDEALENSPI